MSRRHSLFIDSQVYAYTMVFLTVVCIFFGAFYYYISLTSERIALLNQKELGNKLIQQVESYLDEIDHVAYQVMTHSALLNIFNKLSKDTAPENYFEENILMNIDTGSLLTTINGPNRPIWRMSVYNQYGDYISSGAVVDKAYTQEVLGREDVEGQMIELMRKEDKMWVGLPEKDRWSDIYSSKYITIKRPLMNIYSKEVYGLVEVQQDVKKLEEKLAFDVMESINLIVRDEQGQEILAIWNGRMEQRHVKEVACVSKKYGWSVVLSEHKVDMMAPYQNLISIIFVGSIMMSLVMISVIMMIAKRLSRPLITLKDTVGQLTIQSIQIDKLEEESIDEVRELNEAFLKMINRLNQSILLEKKAWLLALQSQMNPHFLYNTLAVISGAGMEEGNDKVVSMCASLSGMLRYSASYEEQSVSFEKEIEHVTSYLELMKWRYEEYFSYEIDSHVELMEWRIPKLILQPLAENCFTHGFADVEPPYLIKIEAGIEQGRWYIKVCDNGKGLSNEEQEAIMRKIQGYWNEGGMNYPEMNIGGLGLVSTIIRMQLNARTRVEYSIESQLPRGTMIMLRGDKDD